MKNRGPGVCQSHGFRLYPPACAKAVAIAAPMASCVTTKGTRFRTWLPVETKESPAVEPNYPTTSRSTAP